MSLYAVQVLTGQEAEVCRRLADRRIATLLPQERRLIRRGGAWREEPYTLFRGMCLWTPKPRCPSIIRYAGRTA